MLSNASNSINVELARSIQNYKDENTKYVIFINALWALSSASIYHLECEAIANETNSFTLTVLVDAQTQIKNVKIDYIILHTVGS
jgi:hypothetical protein